MEFPLAARFITRPAGQEVAGRIQMTLEQDLLAWTRWCYWSGDQDKNWDWWTIFLECGAIPSRYECYSAFAMGDLQGLMVLDLKRKRLPVTKPVTVDYLATNPANRRSDHGLKYVGLAFIAVAILRSQEVGAKGSLWLEALPGACGFYENLGMVRGSRISAAGNATFLLAQSGAERVLDEIRARGILEL